MKVLLSIKPEFANKIFDGKKRFEFRRKIFKDHTIRTIVVYASAPISKIIGEFSIDRIIFDDLDTLWRKTEKFSGIDEKYFFEYFGDKEKGYAIKIKDVMRYSESYNIQERLGLNPPQSFFYIRE